MRYSLRWIAPSWQQWPNLVGTREHWRAGYAKAGDRSPALLQHRRPAPKDQTITASWGVRPIRASFQQAVAVAAVAAAQAGQWMA